MSIHDLFQTNGRHCPGAVAIVDRATVLTHGELLHQVNRLAGGLRDLGIRRRDTVAILAFNRYEYLVLYGAIAAVGAIAVPINWRLSREEIQHILEDSGARIVFHDSAHQDAIPSMTGLTRVCFDGPGQESGPSWSRVASAGPGEIPLADADDLFCLVYTAAVAGKPKGAALSHANFLAGNVQTALTTALGPRDVYLNMLPLCHITGINLALTAIHLGARNILLPKFDAQDALALILEHRVTLLASFPPILSMLMAEMERTGRIPDSLTTVMGIDSPETIERFCAMTRSRFWVFYGQSETSGWVTLSDSALCPGTAGRACCLSKVAILGPDDTQLPPDQTGEIGVRGPLVFQGYWNKQALDTSSFRNGWHHTGDLGEMDPEGYVRFKGRKPEKELIKPGGENVYPAEVEAVILQHPEVLETCVIGVPDPKFGEGIKAVCVRQKGSDLTGARLMEFVGSRIARYKKPGYVVFVDSLPRTPDGSVDRVLVKKNHTS
jgi:acyl-CoA synthetase (AMP-forming)/AMP-acid ligase II